MGRIATIKTFLQHPASAHEAGEDAEELGDLPGSGPQGFPPEDPPTPEELGAALTPFYLRDVEILQVGMLCVSFRGVAQHPSVCCCPIDSLAWE